MHCSACGLVLFLLSEVLEERHCLLATGTLLDVRGCLGRGREPLWPRQAWFLSLAVLTKGSWSSFFVIFSLNFFTIKVTPTPCDWLYVIKVIPTPYD